MGFASILIVCAALSLLAVGFLWLEPTKAMFWTIVACFLVAASAGIVASVEPVRAATEAQAPFLYDVLQDAGLVPADLEEPEEFDLIAFLAHVAERFYERSWRY